MKSYFVNLSAFVLSTAILSGQAFAWGLDTISSLKEKTATVTDAASTAQDKVDKVQEIKDSPGTALAKKAGVNGTINSAKSTANAVQGDAKNASTAVKGDASKSSTAVKAPNRGTATDAAASKDKP